MTTILKVTHISDETVILQNESKSINLSQPKRDVIKKLMGLKSQIFVKAKIHKTKGVEILTAVKDRGW